MVDNTIALGIRPLQIDVATPLMAAAKLKAAQTEQQANEIQMKRQAVGDEMRGLATYADSPDFADRWRSSIDSLVTQGHVDPNTGARMRETPSKLELARIVSQTSSPADRALEFQKQQAARDQSNTDRAFVESKRQFDVGQETKNLAPGFVRTPGGQSFVPGGPADPTYIEKTTGAKDKTGEQITEREKAVISRGLDPKDPQNRAFILTGRLPREDQQPLTATDKKAILEADELVLTNQGTIDALSKAKELSPKAYAVPYASALGKTTGLFGSEAGQTTTDLDNLVTGNALSGLKAIFGAAPTEGERKILLEIQGSTSLPDAVRQKIYDRAIVLANRRMEFNKKRADELRGGTFYKSPDQKPGGKGASAASTATEPSAAPAATSSAQSVPQGAIDYLKKNPKTSEQFDEMFGAGAAARVLGVLK